MLILTFHFFSQIYCSSICVLSTRKTAGCPPTGRRKVSRRRREWHPGNSWDVVCLPQVVVGLGEFEQSGKKRTVGQLDVITDLSLTHVDGDCLWRDPCCRSDV
ncbi:hypothetical protein J6590_027340 [Homalodisca vitripennis]|nr:hypothetical protein J6590_027340 [Homalodisca vitripennis]